MSLLRQGKAQALTIYLGEADQWHGRPLYLAIIQLLQNQGCAGATASRALAGYGAGVKLYESGLWPRFSDAIIVIEVIDRRERLERLRPCLEEMLCGGLMTLHDVEVLKYTHALRRKLPVHLTVRQVMSTQLTTVETTTCLTTVSTLLLAVPYRVLPVVDNQQHLQGIISTRDLINAGIFPVRRELAYPLPQPHDLSIKDARNSSGDARQHTRIAQDIMNTQVRTVKGHDLVCEVAQMMIESGLHNLPVVEDDGTLVGMLTQADLLQIVVTSPLMSPQASCEVQPLCQIASPSLRLTRQPTIGAYTIPNTATVNEQTPLEDVIDDLILSPLKCLVVVDDERRIKGIIRAGDVLPSVWAQLCPGLLSRLAHWLHGKQATCIRGEMQSSKVQKARIAADIMKRDVVTVNKTTSIQQCVECMLTTHYKVLPVLDEKDKLIGSVELSSLLQVLLESNE